jgi:NAD(P)-dependent dehydrogenase (short-subunit alcohol dehydrogenase family)
LDKHVNNAGTSSAGHFEDTSDQIWEADIELKLYGAIRCSRNVIPIMKKNGGGRIVNITTPGGKAPTAASVPTSVTRAAGIALTKGMSKDLAADNILVNTVCVGLLKSGQHRTRWEKANASDPTITIDNFYQDMATRVPMGRVGEASEVGGMIAFLVSDRGSYITGASINIDGGMSPVV